MTETLVGHQRPRLFHVPDNRRDDGLGDEAIDLAAMAGLVLDDWQQYCMREMCMVNPDKPYWNPYTERQELKWAGLEAGVVVSRQNGKGSLLEARELAGLYIFGERLIIHSAHLFETSAEAFNRILILIESTPELDRETRRIIRSHGEEGVETMSGQRLKFKTRTKGGGRGLSGDTVVIDEAMYYTSLQHQALMPVLSARPNPLLLYTGSAGDRDSEQFGMVRARALSGADEPRLFFCEWSIDAHNDFCRAGCDEHDDPDSDESVAKANPGLGIRIDIDYVRAERRAMKPAAFLMERLSVGDWPVVGEAWKVIPKPKWEARAQVDSTLGPRYALAIDVTPDGRYSALCAAGQALTDEEGDPRVHIEIPGFETYDHRAGTQWVVPTVLQICAVRRPGYVVIDKASFAGEFWDQLESAGLPMIAPSSREYAQACGAFRTASCPERGDPSGLLHIDQPPLNSAVAAADKRDLADMWAWSKRVSSDDISPLVAATLARWGYLKHLTEKPPVADPWMRRR